MRFRKPYAVFAGLCLASFVIWWKAIFQTFTLALTADAYTQILLVLPITATLLILNYKKKHWEASPSIGIGLTILLASALIAFSVLVDGRMLKDEVRLALEIFALVICWLGFFVLCFGGRVFRSCAFPLLFLLWFVPMPGMVVNGMVAFLQQGTASLTREMFTLIGVPASLSGTFVTIPGLTVEVAQECSSIRSSLMLVVIAMVTSYLSLHSAWGRTVVIVASIPLALAKNALRVFTLAALGAYVDPKILDSPLHHQGGVLFLVIAIAVLYGVIRLVRHFESTKAKPSYAGKMSNVSPSAKI